MKFYDLSCTFKEGMWYYGNPYLPFEMRKIADMKNNGYIARELKMTTHMGTHIECETHWKEEGPTVMDIALDQVCGNAKVLRFTGGCQSLFEIDRKKLEELAKGKLKAGDICILNTNWHKEISDTHKYVFESPYITVDGAKYLCELGIKAIAVDFPMCGDPRDGMDFVPEGTALPDTVFNEHDVPTILGLVDVDKIPDEIFLVALPLKIEGADGSPIRAIGIEF